VKMVDVEGDTPLHDACRLGHVASAKLLVNAGAAKDVKNKKGETPIQLANYIDCEEVVDMLVGGCFSSPFKK